MRKIEETELLGYVQATKEGRNLEFKPCLSWDDQKSRKLREEIIKSIIAMSNTPGGGVIILGIEHAQKGKKSSYKMVGATSSQIRWFGSHYEKVEKHIHESCSEPPDFEMVWGETDKVNGGKAVKFVLIFVNEFNSLPIICSKTGSQKEDNKRDYVLREGDIYTRSYRATWSSKRCTTKELEEIIKLAADKHKQELKVRGYVKLDDLVVKLKEERVEYE
jgi:predicted HTH transcriptional regulator